MPRSPLPLNGLRAFEAAARHLSFTRAAAELNVTQAAISHQVKALEARLGVALFRRLSRGIVLTDEGRELFPELREAFGRIAEAIERIGVGSARGVLTGSVLTTFALAWLLPRLSRFREAYPVIDVRLLTTPHLVDFAREEVDFAVRWGEGHWEGMRSDLIFQDMLTPLSGRAYADALKTPADLRGVPLLHEVTGDDWPIWLRASGLRGVRARGPAFDSTQIAVQAAIEGLGVAIGPPFLFADDIAEGRLFQPFPLTVGNGKGYWLVSPEMRSERPKLKAFREWILGEATQPSLGRNPGAA